MRRMLLLVELVVVSLLSSICYAGVSTIPPNTTLNPGSFLYSPNGQYKLVMQNDGNLVSYAPNGQAKWLTYTQGHPNSSGIMQSDGNFVIYDPSNVPVFLTHTQNQPTNLSFASYQNDGDLYIMTYKASWATNTHNSNQPPSSNVGGGINSGGRLSPNATITSGNGVFTLTMQGDGNLVLTSSGGVVQWASYTAGGGNYAVMQADGNFVIYNTYNQAVWASNTSNHSGSVLILQDDGNLVLYTPIPSYSFATGPINNPSNGLGSSLGYVGIQICDGGIVVSAAASCPKPPSYHCYFDDDGNFICYST